MPTLLLTPTSSPPQLPDLLSTTPKMCSRENRGCHSSESSSCHGSEGSSCHGGGSSCHGSEGLVCHEVTAVPDVTPVVVLSPQCPQGSGQVPLAQVPCQQQQQQIKQPVQWPPQQQQK